MSSVVPRAASHIRPHRRRRSLTPMHHRAFPMFLVGGPLPLILAVGCFCPEPQYEDYETELVAWRQSSTEDSDCFTRFIGECTGGNTLYVYDVFIDTARVVYFDRETGRYLGSEDIGYLNGCIDFRPVFCPSGVITEILCGDFYSAGDAFP